MENIDPIYFLGPIIVAAFSFGLVAYWHSRRRLTAWVIMFSVVAYFGAIATKALIQALSYGPLDYLARGSPWVLGPYFGLQTVFIEVGLAYVFARYAVDHGLFHANDAEGYGISLALWENGVFFAGLAAVDYAVYYVTLGGSGSSAPTLFHTLDKAAPSLFFPVGKALPLVGYQVLERISSLLLHFSWGYLCVLAAVFKKRRFLVCALPMGLVDSFVPFETPSTLGSFEALIFVVGLVSVAVALVVTKGEYRKASVNFASPPATPGIAKLKPLILTNFKRALNFGKVYVIMSVLLPLLPVFELAEAGKVASGSAAQAPAGAILGEIGPLLLPIFMVLGATGCLMIFASDRDKGVYEYMLAYGVDVSTIFVGILAATIILVTLVLGAALSIVVGVLSFTSPGALTPTFVELILLYTIPLSYAGALFMCMAGMIWSQLTVRRAGVNSPVGIAPMLGILPVLAVLLATLGSGSAHILDVVGAASAIMILAVFIMASIANKSMQRERFISSS